MNCRQIDLSHGNQAKGWTKRLSWALPLFFLVKGLLWLLIPFFSAVFVLNQSLENGGRTTVSPMNEPRSEEWRERVGKRQ